ncbi:sporulation integral membrane protein YtvI [Peptococcaceae bacterium 1198_IL3148]
MEPRWYKPALNTIVIISAGLLLLLALGVGLWLTGNILPALIPFIIAIFISFLIEPLVNFLQRKFRLSRGLAVMLAMLLLFGTLGTLLVLLIIQLIAELVSLSATLPGITHELRIYVEQMIPQAIRFYGDLPNNMVSYLQDAIRNFGTMLQSLVEVAATSLLSFLSLVPGTFILIIVTFLATYFIAKDRRAIADFWKRLIPAPYGQKSLTVLREVLAAFISYLKAQSVLVIITTIQAIIGFYIIGVDYALTLGLVVGVLDLIPVLGPATLIIPWAIWFFIQGNIAFGIKLLVLYVTIFVVRQLLEPRIVAANLGLHPLATLLAMYMGLSLLGFIGLILGPILLIAIQATLKAGNIFPKA